MNIAFWDNTLCERGTTTSLFDYAYYNQSILKNKSYIFYTHGQNNNENVINKFKKHFNVTKVNNFEEVDSYLLKYQITHIYIIKYGLIDDRISKVAKNCIHSVFDCRQPHGDIYAAISPWVDYYTETIPVVPHMINLPQCNENLRDKLNIPKDAVVFGGYGGKMQFNIPFVHNTILKVAETHPNIYFLFANFKPINGSQIHSNIIYVPTIIDLEEKVKFINTCDAMLWGRDDGETFGISIGEFSTHNKPVIMTDIGKRAHVHLLGDKGIKYTNTENLTKILINFNPEVESKKDWNAYRDYTPTKVMSQFQSVFLSYKSHFTFIPSKTQMNYDLKRDAEFRNDNSLSQEMKLEKYMQTAFLNKACAGFSTLGYYKSNIENLTKSKYFKNGDGLYIKKKYNDGIYICGCVKNCAKYLEKVFENIQFFSAFFKICRIVIAYDDSYDGSIKKLNSLCENMKLPITLLQGNVKGNKKVINICNARNVILEHIRKQTDNNNFKYMFMMDMDNIAASPINISIFHDAIVREKEWDAIFFNQQDYYDIWALSIDEYICSGWHFQGNQGSKLENIAKIKQHVNQKLRNAQNNELIECKSAFNGVGIYKLDNFINSRYEYNIKKTLRYISADEIKRNEEKIGSRFNINSWAGQHDCEHRYFHLKAQHLNGGKLKLRIHPQFLFKNYIEDDVEQERSKNCHFVSSRGIMECCDINPLNMNLVQYQDDEENKKIVRYMRGIQLRQFLKQGGPNNLNKPIILVTGDCTDTMPNDIFPNHQDFLNFINNKNIIHWFAQNCVLTSHPKLSQIPLGLDYHTMEANKLPEWGPQMYPKSQENILKNLRNSSKPFWEREIKAYGSFHFLMTTRYGKKDRQDALDGVPKDLVYYESQKIKRKESWTTQSKYAFVISPLGNGYDCHRTWEAMILGCIVIMKRNPIDALFTEDMPVLLVDEWTDVTQELLDKTIETYKHCVINKKFNADKLTLKYWMDKIRSKI